jgi:MFS family permease
MAGSPTAQPAPRETATPAEAARGAGGRPARLWSTGFRLLLLVAVLGWSAEAMIQAVLPVRILDLGGNAATVGFVAACFALPSLLLRPAIGRHIDRAGHGGLHQLGVAIAVVAPLGYTLGAIALVPVNRLLQGVGWAMYGTSNNLATARLAPPARRGEAAGFFNVAYATGFLIGPPIALFLYANADPRTPFVVASILALVTLWCVTLLRRHLPPAPAVAPGMPPAVAPGTPPAVGLRRLVRGYLEPSAIPMLAVTALAMAGQALFVGFAPVFARSIDAPLAVLAPFYPVYGVLNAACQLGSGQLSDRIGRSRAVLLGALVGSAGLLVALLASDFLGYAVGASLFAISAGITAPAAAAAAMDAAPEGRMGSTMATFSMAYQIASGVGGLIWGVLIATVGYPAPFALAILLQAAAAVIALRRLPGRAAGGQGS